MSTTNECLRGAGKAAFTESENEVRAHALIVDLGLAKNDYGLTDTNDQPAKILIKTKSYCTTKSISIATYFIAANAVLTGVRWHFARVKFHPVDAVVFAVVVACFLAFGGRA